MVTTLSNAPHWLPSLDPQSTTPLYEQIIESVAIAITTGSLQPEDRLPSVRILAEALRLNPNTTARALREVEREGLARAIRGIGMVIVEDAQARAAIIAGRVLERELGGVVAAARQMKLNLDQLQEALARAWKDVGNVD